MHCVHHLFGLTGASCWHALQVPVGKDPALTRAGRAGGVVVIFSKQQAFLLDDCNEMMVRMHHRNYLWTVPQMCGSLAPA